MTTLIEEAPFSRRSMSWELPDDAPHYCPLCGRPLDYSYWDAMDSDARYHAFVCFGGSWLRLFRRLKVIWPAGLHYRYEFGPTKRQPPPARYDSRTGAPL